MNQANNAAAWRALANKPEEADIVDLELPSGFVVKATRPPLEMWLVSGAIPIEFINKAQEAFGSAGTTAQKQAAVAEALTEDPAQMQRALTFMRNAVQYAVVYPRITLDADPNNPDEISPAAIPEKDFSFIVAWVVAGCPNVPVKTTDGKGTTVSTVENFRSKSRIRGTGKNGSKARRARQRKAPAGR
jgi:hypothetical protein